MRGHQLPGSGRPRHSRGGVHHRAAHPGPGAQADPQDRPDHRKVGTNRTTATAKPVAWRSACVAWRRGPPPPNAWIASPWRKSRSATARLTAVAGAGRFAPSPTGPLHIGSLYTALASFLDARAPRAGMAAALGRPGPAAQRSRRPGQAYCAPLEAHGLHWDGAVQRQSEHLERYAAALATLHMTGSVFFCTCSRKQLRGHSIYPGRCRHRRTSIAEAAVRVRVDEAVCEFTDSAQGQQRFSLRETTGDFVVKRRDGPFAYQLATRWTTVTPTSCRVLRGRDLLGNTPRQLFLMRLLGQKAPAYAHIPVLRIRPRRSGPSRPRHRPSTIASRWPIYAPALALLGLLPPELDLEGLIRWAWRIGVSAA